MMSQGSNNANVVMFFLHLSISTVRKLGVVYIVNSRSSNVLGNFTTTISKVGKFSRKNAAQIDARQNFEAP